MSDPNLEEILDKTYQLKTSMINLCNVKEKGKRVLTQEKTNQMIGYINNMYLYTQMIVDLYRSEKQRADTLAEALSRNDESIKASEQRLLESFTSILKSNLSDDLKTKINTGKKSYSEVASLGALRPITSSKVSQSKVAGTGLQATRENHRMKEQVRKSTVVVKPVEGNSLNRPHDLQAKLAKHINCIDLGVTINKLHPTKRNNLVIRVNNEEEADKLIHMVRDSPELNSIVTVDRPRLIMKRVIISKIPCSYTEEQILKFISKELNCDTFNLKLKKLSKLTSPFYTYLLELPETYVDTLIDKKRLFFDFHSVYVKKFVKIIRCYQCQGYGHLSYNCKQPVACSNCSGSHLFKDCTVDELCCVNCKHENKSEVNCEHSASSSICPVYQGLLKQGRENPVYVRSAVSTTLSDNNDLSTETNAGTSNNLTDTESDNPSQSRIFSDSDFVDADEGSLSHIDPLGNP